MKGLYSWVVMNKSTVSLVPEGPRRADGEIIMAEWDSCPG